MIPDVPETAATPEPPKKRFPVVIVAAVIVALLLIGGAVGSRFYLRWAKAPVAVSGNPVRITVKEGASVEAVAQEIESKGVIRSARVFALAGKGAVIKPGIYDIAPSESVARILSRLQKGDVVTVRVTFPEGFTAAQVAKRLAKNGLCDEATFLELVTKRGDTVNADLPKNLEGYLFPDTYRFPIGATETQIAERMTANFDTVFVVPNRADIEASGRSLADLVTIAAMVEREARVAKDRPLIAGVIYNRLRRGMRLQIDATVQYARKQHAARLLYRDLEVESPYNTYRVAGLPPGAICNPGNASLDAALRPASHTDLFYVATADGSHVFSETYAGHQANIRAVRRNGSR